MNQQRGFIFDLDGVVVDTSVYHYLAWKELAHELSFDFPEVHNERQKGVSRMESLEVVLEVGNLLDLPLEEKVKLADHKNQIYLDMIKLIDHNNILPGIEDFIKKIKADGYKVALGSASKSGEMILKQLELRPLFDIVVDGNLVTVAKPNPEVFIVGAAMLAIDPANTVVVEDAKAGVQAAKVGGMKCIGIGSEEQLGQADIVLGSTKELLDLDYHKLFLP